jgi:basic amino acid/polyamine antiporter, APA family
VIKLFPLVAVIVILGVRAAGEQPWEPLAPQPITVPSIATAVALTLFALLGFENATTPVGKVRDPARTIPRAIMLGTAFVAFLYLLSSTAVTLIVPATTVASSPAPFADAIGTQWGSSAMILAALTIAVSAFGCLNGLILATGELGYSMALRRQLPASIARTRGAGTPVNAQLLGCILAMILVLANSSRSTAGLFTFVILLSTVSVLVLYFIGTLAAWRKSPSTANRVLIAVALIFALFAFYGSGLEANLWGLVLIAVGLAVRAVMQRLNSRGGSSPLEELAPAAPPGSSA